MGRSVAISGGVDRQPPSEPETSSGPFSPHPNPSQAPPIPSTAKSSVATSESIGLFLLNCTLLALVLLLIDTWISRFTNLNRVRLGMLGIPGIIAACAALARLLQEERLGQILKLIDRRVLQHRRTWIYLVGAFLPCLFATSWWGSVELNSTQSKSFRIELYSVDSSSTSKLSKPVAVVRLGPQESAKRLLATGFLGRRRYEIRIAGLPVLKQPLRAFQLVPLNVPESFLTGPVLLVHPGAWISGTAHKNPSAMRITLGGTRTVLLSDYRGESVWIGGGGRLAIPPELTRKWKDAISDESFVQRLLTPKSVAPDVALAPGNSVRIELFTCDPQVPACLPYARADAKVAEVPDFPQEVFLNGPT